MSVVQLLTVCPNLFEVDDSDLKAKIKTAGGLATEAEMELASEQQSEAKEAESGCPTEAIKLE